MFKQAGILLFTLFWRVHTQDDVGYFWHVTDFHYDWSYFKEQLSCNVNVTNPGKYGDYMCDSPWTLVNDSIVAMEKLKSDVDFIIWTGDNAPHVTDDEIDVDKTVTVMDNITELIEDVFPGVPVYATFGNHDFYPHNQVPIGNFSGELFRRMAEKWKPWIVENAQVENFKKGGYYTVMTRGLRILSLNTNLYYTSNKVTSEMDDPLDQFQWADNVLRQAKENNEKVLVMAHIPPGILAPSNVAWLYKPHNARLLQLFRKFADVIVAMHYGHEHADSFKLLKDTNGLPKVPIFIAPSVTPWRYVIPNKMGPPHNPGIRLIKYNRKTYTHLDYTQYFINLPDSNRNHRADWTVEYSMKDAYGIPDLSPKSIQTLIQKIKESDKDLLMDYFKRTTVSTSGAPETCDDTCEYSIGCSFTNFDMDEFKHCLDVASIATTFHVSVNSIPALMLTLYISFVHLY